VSGARRALAFLTPVGGAAPPAPDALVWFPVVGALIGTTLGLVWWGAGNAWPRGVAAALVVAADLLCTGLLHLDGVIDSADGLIAPMSRDRRLQVMRDPHAGAFGASAAIAVVLLRWAALSSLRPSIVLLVGIWAASRTLMAVVADGVPYARAETGGLATAFVPAGRFRVGVLTAVVGAIIAVPAVVWWRPVAGVVALAAGLVAGGGVVVLAWRRVGGFTGDVLGAAGVVLETVALVVAAARW